MPHPRADLLYRNKCLTPGMEKFVTCRQMPGVLELMEPRVTVFSLSQEDLAKTAQTFERERSHSGVILILNL